MPKKECLFAPNAPKALGPYNVATRFGELVFASGQLGLDPATGEIVPGGIEAEARQALLNIQNVLEASGCSLEAVLKTTVFLRDMGEFAKMNAIYAEFFRDDFPARSTIQVAALPRGGAVEIEAIACLVS